MEIGFNQRVGANLRRLRKANGITQAALAGLLSREGLPFHQQTIMKLESGARSLSLEEAITTADVLGVNLRWIAYADDDQWRRDGRALRRCAAASARLAQIERLASAPLTISPVDQ